MAGKSSRLAMGFSLPKVEKKTVVSEKVAESFLAEEKPISHKKMVEKTSSKRREKITSINKASKLRRDKRGERVTSYLPPKVAEKLRLRCARERRSVSDAVTEAVELLLRS